MPYRIEDVVLSNLQRKAIRLQEEAGSLWGKQKVLGLLKHAEEAVEQAMTIESLHIVGFGGHKHEGRGNPLLTETPLPSGWGRVAT